MLKYPGSPGNVPLFSTPDYVGVLELGWKGEWKRRGWISFASQIPGKLPCKLAFALLLRGYQTVSEIS